MSTANITARHTPTASSTSLFLSLFSKMRRSQYVNTETRAVRRVASCCRIVPGARYHVEYKVEDDETRLLTYVAIEPDLDGLSTYARQNVVRADACYPSPPLILPSRPSSRVYVQIAHHDLNRRHVKPRHVAISTSTTHLPQTEETQYWWCMCESEPWVGDFQRFLKRHLTPLNPAADVLISLPDTRKRRKAEVRRYEYA